MNDFRELLRYSSVGQEISAASVIAHVLYINVFGRNFEK
jgi:hypothetical protein